MTVTKIVFVFVAIKQLVDAETPCQTPNLQPGACIPLDQCPPLSAHFNNGPLSAQAKDDLRRHHCGFAHKTPKVCCPFAQKPTSPPSFITSSPLLPEQCGAYTSDRIIGGNISALDEFPWMAILRYRNPNTGEKTWECGGSLINKRYVLTAAHCLVSTLIGVRLGEFNVETDPDCVRNSFGADCAPPAIDFGIEEKIIYPSYDGADPSHYHDIGLIRLDRDVQYSDFIKPVCLPLAVDELSKNYVGQQLTVAGWGITEKGTKSNLKLKVQVPVRDLDECSRSLNKINSGINLASGQLCAGGVRNKDSCRADSGGPLMTFKIDRTYGSKFYVVGVVSFGPTPCGKSRLPGVYTKVCQYVSWIVDNLRP